MKTINLVVFFGVVWFVASLIVGLHAEIAGQHVAIVMVVGVLLSTLFDWICDIYIAHLKKRAEDLRQRTHPKVK